MLEHPLLGPIIDKTVKIPHQDPDILPRHGMILQVLKTMHMRPLRQRLIMHDLGIPVQDGQLAETLIAGLDNMRVLVAGKDPPWALQNQDSMVTIGRKPMSPTGERPPQITGGAQEQYQEKVVWTTDQKGFPILINQRDGNTIIFKLPWIGAGKVVR